MWQWLSTEKPKTVMIAALKLILFWLSQMIYLMGTQSAVAAYGITVKSQEVKVRLPLNLKNMRGVHGVSTRVVPVYAACQVCMHMCDTPVHVCERIMCRQTAGVKNNCDLIYWERQKAPTPSCVPVHHTECKSAKKCAYLSEHVSQLMNVFAKYPGLWLILNIDWSHNAMRAG